MDELRERTTSDLIRLLSDDQYLKSIADPLGDLDRASNGLRALGHFGYEELYCEASTRIRRYRLAAAAEIDRRIPVPT